MDELQNDEVELRSRAVRLFGRALRMLLAASQGAT